MIRENTRILFLDEAIFSFNTFSGKAWSHNKYSIQFEERKCMVKTHALLAAIKIDGTMEPFDIYPSQ